MGPKYSARTSHFFAVQTRGSTIVQCLPKHPVAGWIFFCNYKMNLCEIFAWRPQGPAAPSSHSVEFKKGQSSRLAIKIITQGAFECKASNFTSPPRLCFPLFVLRVVIFAVLLHMQHPHKWHHLAWVPHTHCSLQSGKVEEKFFQGRNFFSIPPYLSLWLDGNQKMCFSWLLNSKSDLIHGAIPGNGGILFMPNK